MTVSPVSNLSCAACRGHLGAYVERELPASLQHRVSCHLDECDDCYAAYRRQVDVQRQLTRPLPSLGTADARQLGRIWESVNARRQQPLPSVHVDPARVSLAALLVAAALLLPLLVSARRLPLPPPVPPTPIVLDTLLGDGETPPPGVPLPIDVAFLSEQGALRVTPPAHPNFAPPLPPGSTESP